jgi:hypothetical protein
LGENLVWNEPDFNPEWTGISLQSTAIMQRFCNNIAAAPSAELFPRHLCRIVSTALLPHCFHGTSADAARFNRNDLSKFALCHSGRFGTRDWEPQRLS